MLPVFNKYIEFLNSQSKKPTIELREGFYWVDNQIVKCFANGKEVKVFRIDVAQDLTISFKTYKSKEYDKVKHSIESWQDTYDRLKDDILSKEQESIEQIKLIANKYPNHQIVLTTSKGKDSNLTDYLLQKANINNYRVIFNNTTLDCADVYKDAKQDKRIEIVTPKMSDGTNRSFYRMVDKHGTPTRFNRWCCSYFKEGGTKQYFDGIDNILFVMGMRNEESETRSDYDFEWQNEMWTNKTWIGLLPIRKWTELELWLYTIVNNIPINDKYKKGYSRCGYHIACPYYAKSTWVLDKFWYQGGYVRWHKILEKDFIYNEKWYRLNCTLEEYYANWNGGLVRKEPNEEVISEFMKHKGLDDKNIALKYFNKTCMSCTTKRKPTNVCKKDVVAMNMKFLGKNITQFMCKKCLMKYLEITKEQWKQKVEEFKQQGCKLF